MSSTETVTSGRNVVEKGIDTLPLSVAVTYGEVKAEFSGSPETVLQAVNTFIAKQIPEIALARRLTVNFSIKDLIDKFQDHVKITPEGPRVWNSGGERKYSDKEIVALQLVAQKIASETTSATDSSMSLTSLQETTSLNSKSLSSRLSELSKSGLVTREVTESGTTFKITTQGAEWLSSTLAKKLQQQGKS